VQKSFAVQTRVIQAMASVLSDEELERTAETMTRVGDAIDELISR